MANVRPRPHDLVLGLLLVSALTAQDPAVVVPTRRRAARTDHRRTLCCSAREGGAGARRAARRAARRRRASWAAAATPLRQQRLDGPELHDLVAASVRIVGHYYRCKECEHWHFSGASGFCVDADGHVAQLCPRRGCRRHDGRGLPRGGRSGRAAYRVPPFPCPFLASPSSAGRTSASRASSTGSSGAVSPSSSPRPGVTRDRVTVVVAPRGPSFELVDTGGLGLVDEALLKDHVEAQIQFALDSPTWCCSSSTARRGACRATTWWRAVAAARQADAAGRQQGRVASTTRSASPSGSGSASAIRCRSAPRRASASRCCSSASWPSCRRKVEDEDPEEGDVLRFAIIGKRNSGKSTMVNRSPVKSA
jgi:hypothetical protein